MSRVEEYLSIYFNVNRQFHFKILDDLWEDMSKDEQNQVNEEIKKRSKI